MTTMVRSDPSFDELEAPRSIKTPKSLSDRIF
jgi:hypothetical protein